MDYKTLIVHVDTARAADVRIRLAIDVARECGAHLAGTAVTGVSHFVTSGMLAAGDSRLAGRAAAMRHDAAVALRRFDALARSAGLASFECRLVDDDIDGGLAVQARYCDLIVAGQPDPAAPAPDRRADLPDYLLLTTGRPVLVVPHTGGPWRLDGEALVAWDGSAEATRAVTAALPLLRVARGTTVTGLGDDTAAPGDGDPYVRLAAWLGRHGIAACTGRSAAAGDVGEALLSTAADMDAGLLVMGGYGHARYRELVLGGVTATLLRAMTLPVLLAH
jgi:nucleotide-binding universal stress UspA family protein